MPRVRRRELRHQTQQSIREHLQLAAAAPFLPEDRMHAADLADVLWLDFEPEEARRVFQDMGDQLSADVLEEAEPKLQQILLEGADNAYIGKLVGLLSYDDAADLLDQLPEETRLEVMCFLPPEDARELRHLAEYEPDTAGGLMTTEFLTARISDKVGDVLKRIKRDEGESETVYAAYVVDEAGTLLGVVSTRDLLDRNIHVDVGDVMIPDVIHAKVDEDQEAVAHRLLHYNLSMMPVVDPRGVVVGIVTADDALEVLEDEGSEDAFLLAGASGASEAAEPFHVKVLHRAPMLAIPVFAGLFIAEIYTYFAERLGNGAVDSTDEATLVGAIILSFIPMVLAVSGTVGMQTSAVLVRGFAVGQIIHGRRMPVFLGEMQVGVGLGLICGLVAGPAMGWIMGSLTGGMMLGLALALAVAWAAVASSSIAMGAEAVGLDPALVSGPVMIAVSDLSAVVLFLGTATLMAS